MGIAASLLLVLMALLNFLHVAIPSVPAWASGICAWLALALLFMVLPWRAFTQFLVLSALGLLLLLWAGWQGAAFSVPQWLQQNNSLLVMLFSVSFLRLVAVPGQEVQALPRGRWAYLQTLLGIHLLGAVINLSIVVLVAGRYQAAGLLRRDTVALMGQAFAAAAFWSPFFAAMGVALTYAPGANLWAVMGYGAVFALLSIGVSLVLAGGWRLQRLADFPGYPMQLSSLLVPAVLAVSVLALHALFPAVAVLALVSVGSVGLALLVLLLRDGRAGWPALRAHVLSSGTRMARELSLFLGAGVLTVGLQAVLAQAGAIPFLDTFGGLEAALLLAGAIGLSMIGVHPVISIAVLGPLLQPLQPDMTLVAVLFLAMWALGVVASPFSGMNVMLRGQFGLSGRDLFAWNIHFVLVMWVVLAVALTGIYCQAD